LINKNNTPFNGLRIGLFLLYSVFLFSCNPSKVANESPTVLTQDVKTVGRFMDTVAKYKTDVLVIKGDEPINYITVGKLDIMKTDLGFFDTKQAEIACKKLGDGWRLPTEAELNLIYEKNEELGEFKTNYYLGMENGTDAYNEDVTMHLRMSIISGEVVLLQTDQELFSQYGVRAVRDHKP
jgi:hypothetical protein